MRIKARFTFAFLSGSSISERCPADSPLPATWILRRVSQIGLGLDTAVSLVDEHHGQLETAPQLPRKPFTGAGHWVSLTVRVDGPTHDQQVWSPLLDQRLDLQESGGLFCDFDQRKRFAGLQQRIAGCDANASPAKIKCEHAGN